MSNRLVDRMTALKAEGRKAFVAYVMAGEPDWAGTHAVLDGLERAGVTAVELGVPFSDPIADGPVIQAAGNRALAAGVTLQSIFDQVRVFRRRSEMPILLMGYWNVFLQYGRTRVLDASVEAGVDGFIIPDLPADADPEFFAWAREREICTVLLATELTRDERLAHITAATTGFLYYVPKLGITGLSLEVTDAIRGRLEQLKAMTGAPVCVGIGVKTREDVERLTAVADGVIVGTRLVELIDQHRDAEDLGDLVAETVAGLLPGGAAGQPTGKTKGAKE